ncbi:hypothetical protein E9840_11200 [Tissierella creatinini]|nr:hypothetical protein E9840_11200 [Tissierella creatinini]TJX62900.1 hypothetical protein E8P77_16250 [Soehngenia saccharolytica]
MDRNEPKISISKIEEIEGKLKVFNKETIGKDILNYLSHCKKELRHLCASIGRPLKLNDKIELSNRNVKELSDKIILHDIISQLNSLSDILYKFSMVSDLYENNIRKAILKNISLIYKEIEHTHSFINSISIECSLLDIENTDIYEIIEMKDSKLTYKNPISNNNTSQNKDTKISLEKYFSSQSDKINRIKFNMEFRQLILECRDKNSIFSRNDFNNNFEGNFNKEIDEFIYQDQIFDFYSKRFDYILFHNDIKMSYFKEFINDFIEINAPKKMDLTLVGFINTLYYLLFDKLVSYDTLTEIIGKYFKMEKEEFEITNIESYKYLNIENDEEDDEEKTKPYKIFLDYNKEKHEEELNRYKILLDYKKNIKLIEKYRLLLGIKSNKSIENINYNCLSYYKYLYTYDNYKSNRLLDDISNIMNEFAIFDSRNQLDYTLLLYYLIYDEVMEYDKSRWQLEFLLPKSYKSEELINGLKTEVDVCYVVFPIYADWEYFESNTSYFNSLVVEAYNLPTGSDRMNNDVAFYRNKSICYRYIYYRDQGFCERQVVFYSFR